MVGIYDICQHALVSFKVNSIVVAAYAAAAAALFLAPNEFNAVTMSIAGYGQSTGKPSEKNLYADIEASWHALRSRYGVSPENIILYGQSIGTVPTVDLASRYEVR